jgi:peptide/nickel transport system permease protein
MIRDLLTRLATALLLVLAALSLVFLLAHLAPGDPAGLQRDPDLDAAGRAQLRHEYGLDRPLAEQYLRWLGGAVLHGDLGRSLRLHREVSDILAEAVPRTLLLTLVAYLVHLAVAVPLGVWMARRHGGAAERAVGALGLALHSLPAFWLGLMLVLVFARGLGWLPASGMHAPDHALLPWPARLLDTARHLVLPVVVLGLATAAGTARYVRQAVLEVLDAEFITAARARGLPERVVIWRHALRNALLPVVTLVGLNLPALLGGAVVTETVFAWPGMGRVAVEALWARDYPVILGAAGLSAVMVVVGNLLADLCYAVVDPRARPGGEGRT